MNKKKKNDDFIVRDDVWGKPKKNKAKSANEALKNISYKHLRTTIKGYGYEYSLKSYMLVMLSVLIALVGVSYFFMLEMEWVILLAALAICVVPIIIIAQFRYIANNDKFEQMVNYIDQMVLSFKRNPKILAAMESTLDMVDGAMKKCVKEAINIIKTDSKSENVYLKAFEVIEKEFRSSRIKTLHRFILNVEKENSVSYQESIDNLYFDCRSWVTRTYQYQSALAATKKKIVIVLGISVAIGAFFASVLSKAEESAGSMYDMDLIGNPLYQGGTFIFLAAFIVIYAVLNTKVNGYWLINDIDNKNEKLIESYIEKVENYDSKAAFKKTIIATIVVSPLFIAGLILHNRLVTIMGLAVCLLMLFKSRLSYSSKKKAIEKELLKEFPIWMRDIAINLNNMVVVRAIEQSIENSATVLRPFLQRFMANSEKDPVSINPYLNFLGMFNVSELSTAVKVLYSIKMLSAEDSQRQINDLIVRNQTLLESSEKIRHEDSIAGVSFISMLPMVLLSGKLMLDMSVMMFSFMSIASA